LYATLADGAAWLDYEADVVDAAADEPGVPAAVSADAHEQADAMHDAADELDDAADAAGETAAGIYVDTAIPADENGAPLVSGNPTDPPPNPAPSPVTHGNPAAPPGTEYRGFIIERVRDDFYRAFRIDRRTGNIGTGPPQTTGVTEAQVKASLDEQLGPPQPPNEAVNIGGVWQGNPSERGGLPADPPPPQVTSPVIHGNPSGRTDELDRINRDLLLLTTAYQNTLDEGMRASMRETYQDLVRQREEWYANDPETQSLIGPITSGNPSGPVLSVAPERAQPMPPPSPTPIAAPGAQTGPADVAPKSSHWYHKPLIKGR
jgi:hypothetical protein